MKLESILHKFFYCYLFVLSAILTSCGGGGGGSSAPISQQGSPNSQPSSAFSSSVSSALASSSSQASSSASSVPRYIPITPIPSNLFSMPTDLAPVGANYVYLKTNQNGEASAKIYTLKNSSLFVTSKEFSQITVDLQLEKSIYLLFELSSGSVFSQGYYEVTHKGDFISFPNMSMNGCESATGWFAIDQIAFDSIGDVTSLDLRFETTCDLVSTFGQIHWSLKNVTTSSRSSVSQNLWQPDAWAIPDSGSYVYWESDQGDFIGGGKKYLFTGKNSKFIWYDYADSSAIRIDVLGDTEWSGLFIYKPSTPKMAVGYYSGFNGDRLNGDLDWSGNGRMCGTDVLGGYNLNDWYSVDSIKYNSNGDLESIDIRFERHCPSSTAGHRGKIHWDVNDKTVPPGPRLPPSWLWRAPQTAVPSEKNYFYFEEEPVSQQSPYRTAIFQQTDSSLIVESKTKAEGGGLGARINILAQNDNDYEYVSLVAPEFLDQLEPGYYADLHRYPFHNVLKGGIETRGCNTLDGWFVIDKINYGIEKNLQLLDARYELVCDGGFRYRGQLHWSSDDKSAPPSPINPPPASLWRPAESLIPKSGNFVLLVSDPLDYVGQGKTVLVKDSAISVDTLDILWIHFDDPNTTLGWHGSFRGLVAANYQLQVGYYGMAQRSSRGNPARGGMDWGGNGNGCNTLGGWFVVDKVVYTSGVVTALDARFEQHCEGAEHALRGMIHWVK